MKRKLLALAVAGPSYELLTPQADLYCDRVTKYLMPTYPPADDWRGSGKQKMRKLK